MTDQDILQQFKAEVLDGPDENLLPYKLSDKWLMHLIEQGNVFLQGADENARATEIVAIVLQLLSVKMDTSEVSISEEELFTFIESYIMELAIEELNRKTDLSVETATLETILNPDRRLEFRLRGKADPH